MEEKICSFFGHRKITVTERLYSLLTIEIFNAIHSGCRVFYFGGYGEFDRLCYETVTEIQEENPEFHIKRVYCVAQERYLRKRARYFNASDYEELIYLQPSFEGWYKSLYFRNCAMIDKSDFVIFYAEERENSGAYKAYKYAKLKKKLNVVNIF